MRLKFAVLAMSVVALSLSSNLASAAKFQLGQKVISAGEGRANYVGVINDIRGDRYQVEIDSVVGATFGLQAEECTGNKSLEGSSGSRGEKIWVPEYCLVDPVQKRADEEKAKKAAQKAAADKDASDKLNAQKSISKLSPAQKIEKEKLGTVEQDGLTWMKCYYGQSWDGQSCIGKPEIFNNTSFMSKYKELPIVNFAGHSDWRIPTIQELATIIVCKPEGHNPVVEQNEGGYSVKGCKSIYSYVEIGHNADNNRHPMIDTNKFFTYAKFPQNQPYYVDTEIVFSSSIRSDWKLPISLHFAHGQPVVATDEKRGFIRLVRGGN